MAGVHGVILSLANAGPLHVIRRLRGTWTDGNYTPTPSTSTIVIEKAVIQPIDGEQVSDLEEAIRGDELLQIHTLTRLVGVRRAAGDPDAEPDELTDAPSASTKVLSGELWRVVRVSHWPAFGGYHCKAVLARIKR